MQIAVVILNYNGKNWLAQFLPDVIAYSQEATIIIADNASTDDSIPFLSANFPSVKILKLAKNFGFAQGYNEALKIIEADIFVLLNSDVAVTKNWLQPLLRTLQSDSKIAACQPKILSQKQPTQFEHAGASGGFMDSLGYPFCRGRIFDYVETDVNQYDNTVPIAWASGAALAIKADIYRTFGGFDGDYFAHMEEIDLCWRIREAGYRIMVVPESIVYHVGGGTLDYENPRKVYLNFRNGLITIIKNENYRKLLWLFPLRLILDGVAGIMFLSKRQTNSMWAIVKAHFYVYSNIFKIIKKKKQYQLIIQQNSIGEFASNDGILKGSIVWSYYIKKIKKFAELKL